MKKTIVAALACILILALAGIAYAGGAIKIVVNGEEIKSDVPAFIRDGRTVVPIRFIAEALGAKVSWDNTSSTVKIDAISKADIYNLAELEDVKRYLYIMNENIALLSYLEALIDSNDISSSKLSDRLSIINEQGVKEWQNIIDDMVLPTPDDKTTLKEIGDSLINAKSYLLNNDKTSALDELLKAKANERQMYDSYDSWFQEYARSLVE